MATRTARSSASSAAVSAETVPRVPEDEFAWALRALDKRFWSEAQSAVGHLHSGGQGYGLLMAVAADEPRSQQALGQRLGIDKTPMTYLVDALEGAGLVTRRPDPADRRAKHVLITDAGREALRQAEQQLDLVVDRLLSVLDPDEAVLFRRLLSRVAHGSDARGAGCGADSSAPPPRG